MQNEEQRLIENLFSRLKQAESQSAPRDAAAEKLIQQQLQSQPGAPYYMAQAILIQEAAMNKLNQRVSELESQLAQQPQQSSGGFLSGLFGGGNRAPQSAPQQPAWNNAPPQQPYAAQPTTAMRGGGFLGGALQTAVGVAGGVVMADMLTSMFHHSQPEEIVNIINEPAMPDQPDTSLDTFNQGGNDAFLNQDAGLQQDYTNDYDDFGNDGFDNDSFNDDDSFI
ncbi:DUF2076 domain-containing protein [Paramixta manurensis]|uniref:DUF2076 domain-containing protein n=1 Tax=Paramixta manurensis TaxID=2740817 RepID=A0A6M8UL31_9GAMM|nr:DUF2076 domain-containing protein [Erwiniaceae bacterium PD-1]